MLDEKEIVLIILTLWLVFVSITFFGLLDFWQSSFFNFGPNDTLAIIGINYKINTWPRYVILSSYLFLQTFIITFCGDYIYPWINAVVLNPDIGNIKISKFRAWIITNSMYTLFMLFGLFSIGLTWSQFDFWLYSSISTFLAGSIQSWIRIRKKNNIIITEEDQL